MFNLQAKYATILNRKLHAKKYDNIILYFLQGSF